VKIENHLRKSLAFNEVIYLNVHDMNIKCLLGYPVLAFGSHQSEASSLRLDKILPASFLTIFSADV
jgi:hypothetical protein